MIGNVCNLKKNPDGKGYTPESIGELQEFISNKFYDALDIAYNSDDFSRTSKRLIKKALQEIGDKYNNIYLLRQLLNQSGGKNEIRNCRFTKRR